MIYICTPNIKYMRKILDTIVLVLFFITGFITSSILNYLTHMMKYPLVEGIMGMLWLMFVFFVSVLSIFLYMKIYQSEMLSYIVHEEDDIDFDMECKDFLKMKIKENMNIINYI